MSVPSPHVDRDALRALAHLIPTPVILASVSGSVWFANEAACALYGYSLEEIARCSRTDLCDPTDPRLLSASRERAERGQFTGQLRMRARDGTHFEAELTSAHVADPSGEGWLWLAVRDLRDAARAEANEARFSAAIEASSDAFALLRSIRDVHGAIIDFEVTHANAAALMLNRAVDASYGVGRRICEADPDIRQAGWFAQLVAVADSERPLDDVIAYPPGAPADATFVRWLHRKAVRLSDGVAISLADVTERKMQEQALREREHELQALSDATHEAIFVFREGIILATNRAARELFQLGADGGVGRAVMEYVAPESADAIRHHLARPTREPYETVALTADGSKVPVAVSARDIVFRGKPARLATIRDLSELRRMQSSLAFADRMASVGTLAAGVAHEINNPLSFIALNVEDALRSLEGESFTLADAPSVVAMLHDARQGAQRVRDIVRDLKAFSRADDETSGPVDLRPVIAYATRMVAGELRHRAQLRIDVPELPGVPGNETRLGQVFLNLLVNAAQAIPQGAVGEHFVSVRASVRGNEVEVAVSDTGTGIEPTIQARIFDPFVTTKSHGTGLGLSICHGIVTRLGGRIDVESAVGMGTTFRVTLPIVAPNADLAHQEKRHPAVSASRRARVIIIDDEPLLLRTATRILEPRYDVVTTTSANDALTTLAAGETFDVVLCDLLMPQMTGMDFYEQLIAAHPAMAQRVVFLTGGVFTPSAERFLEANDRPRLDKPFSVNALLAIVAETALEDRR